MAEKTYIKSKKRVQERGEVFTNEREVKAMLDMIKDESERIDSRVLEPACGNGNFVSEVLHRKLKTVKKTATPSGRKKVSISDYEKLSTLAVGCIYGIDIMMDNVIECRQRIYNIWHDTFVADCKQEPDKDLCDAITFIITRNIICGNTLSMKQVNEKSEDIDLPIVISEWSFAMNNQIQRKDYRYDVLVDNKSMDASQNMQWDVIISNPPYQLADSSLSASASPIYNKFVEQAKKLSPKYLTMIIPSRWMVGGKGLNKFREDMISDKHITQLHDYINSEDCFSGVDIKGGVCYFLRESGREAKCKIVTHNSDGVKTSIRYLKEDGVEVFIRQSELIEIKEKVWKDNNQKSFADIVSVQKPYGFRTDFFAPTIQKEVNGKKHKVSVTTEEKYGLVTPSDTPIKDGYEIIGLIGNKRTWKYVPNDYDFPKSDGLGKYKIFIPSAYGCGALGEVPSTPVLGTPVQACTETFVECGGWDTLTEATNALNYLKTKLFRCLVGIYKQTQHASNKTYRLVPMQDFTDKSDIDWSQSISNIDKQLYLKYNLTDDEIEFIENNVISMG